MPRKYILAGSATCTFEVPPWHHPQNHQMPLNVMKAQTSRVAGALTVEMDLTTCQSMDVMGLCPSLVQ